MVMSPSQVGSPSVQQAPVNQPNVRINPFRVASVERNEIILSIAKLQTAGTQPNVNPVIGTGFYRSVYIKHQMVTAANVAAVTFTEDGPYNASGQIVLHDVNGDLINLSQGFHAALLARYSRLSALSFGPIVLNGVGTAGAVAGPTNVTGLTIPSDVLIYNEVTGGGATGGSFLYWLELPAAINDRDLIGLLGNQDRAQTYTIRDDFAPSATVYGVPPTALGTLTQTYYYGSRSVPNPYNPDGSQNQVAPNTYGTLHNWTEAIDQAAPTASSQITHRLQRIGNTIRSIGLVFRNLGTTRSTFETGPFMPTGIQLKIGDQTLFSEDTSLRRSLMWKRYGFDAPNGVLWYEWTHDWDFFAGNELGHDWVWSQDIVDFNLLNTYPAGVGAASTLTWLVDDLTVPAGVDLYNP